MAFTVRFLLDTDTTQTRSRLEMAASINVSSPSLEVLAMVLQYHYRPLPLPCDFETSGSWIEFFIGVEVELSNKLVRLISRACLMRQ